MAELFLPIFLSNLFRSDSSFNFFAFFFIFFAQVAVYVIMTIGVPGWGFRYYYETKHLQYVSRDARHVTQTRVWNLQKQFNICLS